MNDDSFDEDNFVLIVVIQLTGVMLSIIVLVCSSSFFNSVNDFINCDDVDFSIIVNKQKVEIID